MNMFFFQKSIQAKKNVKLNEFSFTLFNKKLINNLFLPELGVQSKNN